MDVKLSICPVSGHSRDDNSPMTSKLASRGEIYLEKALSCLENVNNGTCEKPILLGKIAVAMQSLNPKKASEIFQQMLICTKQLGQSDKDLIVRAKTIHFICMKSQEEAMKAISSLENSYQGLEVMCYYLQNYGVKGSPLVNLCQKKFNEWKMTKDTQIVDFARAFINFDFDYFLGLLNQVDDIQVKANEIITAAAAYKNKISMAVIESCLNLIDLELKIKSNDDNLQYIKLKLCLLRGMERKKIEELVSFFKTGAKNEKYPWSPRNEALNDLACHLKEENLKEALDISLMCVKPQKVMERVLRSITLEQFELARPYMDIIECPLERIQLWLFVVSKMAESYPECVKDLLSELIAMVENCPNGKELYMEPGRGNRSRDANISYLNEKIRFMESIVELHFDVGAIDKAEELKNHPLLKKGGAKSLLKHKLKETQFYRTEDQRQAEKCCEEALVIMNKVDAYDWDHEDIKEKIASLMLELNPERALEIVLGMREKYKINRLLFDFIKVTSKSNYKFAEKCIENMSEDKLYAKEKAKGYLKLVWE